MNRIFSGHWNAYIFIILTSVMSMIAVASLPFKIKPFGDDTFHEESRDLALFLKGQFDASNVRITKAPGPVLFYTPAYFFAPSGSDDETLWFYGVAMTTILLTVSMLLLYRSALALFSRKTALLTVLLFLVFPIHCYYSLGIVGEVPAFFSMSLAIFGWSRCVENPNRSRGYWLIALGLLLLVLNRPNAMLVLCCIPLVMAYSYIWAKPFFYRHSRRLAAVFTAVLILGISCLQVAKSISGPDKSYTQETLLYYVLHEGRFQFREEPLDWRYWESTNRPDSRDYLNWKQSHRELHEVMANSGRVYKDVYREWLVADALDNPGLLIRQFFVKVAFGHVYIVNSVTPQNFSMGPFKGPAAYYALHAVINLVNLAIVTGMLIFLFSEKNHLRVWLLWSAILALIAFHALSYMEPRYLFPSKAALHILAAAGLMRIGAVASLMNRLERIFYPQTQPVWKTQNP